MNRLRQGQDVAVVSDAGTPLVNDPGFKLVQSAQAEGIKCVPIPGCSSILAALSVCPLPCQTFTYLGFKVDQNAQCSIEGKPVENLWAAGETMAGSILGQGYLAGFGMTIGTVFGRIAGEEAAKYAV